MNFYLKHIRTVTAILFIAVIFSGCDTLEFKEDIKTYDGDILVKFNTGSATLFAEQQTDVVTVDVSTLKPVGESRTYSFSAIDTTLEGSRIATEGEDYELESNTFTIPADSVLGTIPITLNKDNLADSPKLFLRITDQQAASYNSVISLTLRQFTPYNQADFVGEFELTYPWWYETQEPVTVTTIAGEDENTIIVQNMLGTGTDIPITFDDSDKANFTISFDKQEAWVSGQFGSVRMQGSGTFDAKNIEINAQAEHTVSAGTFGTFPFTMVKKE